MSELLKAEGISKSFSYPKGVEILKNITFTLEAGETLAIMGASGEGKSTLLHILGALDKASSGTLFFRNAPYLNYSPYELRNRHFGFVFQSFHLFEDDSAIENILLPAKIMRLGTSKGSENYKHALHLLESTHLMTHAHTPVKLLSGGQRQRVAIARAFCNDPDIIFADEPTGNLDHKTSEEIHSLLISQAKATNKGLIVVTHDQELAKMCDRIFTLENGVIAPLNSYC